MATNLNDIITLQAGKIVLTQTVSNWGIEIDSSSPVKFGLVYMINDLCDNVSVGQVVTFNLNDATQLTHNSSGYYLISENKVGFVEAPAP